MKAIAIVSLLLLAGCEQTSSAQISHTIEAATNVNEPVNPTTELRNDMPAGSFALVGVPTGPTFYPDEKTCLANLNTYKFAMDVDVGNGNSSQLKCVTV